MHDKKIEEKIGCMSEVIITKTFFHAQFEQKTLQKFIMQIIIIIKRECIQQEIYLVE